MAIHTECKIDTGPYKGVVIQTATFFPAEAEMLLSVAKSAGFTNRKLSGPNLTKIKDSFLSGISKMFPNPIIIDEFGVLIDGQHRCTVCVQTQKPFNAIVFRNVPRESFTLVDCNKTRSLSDILRIEGKQNETQLAVTVNWIHKFRSNDPRLTGLDNETGLEIANQYAGRINRSWKIVDKRSLGYLTPGILTFCHLVCSSKNQTDADLFFDALVSGEHLKKGELVFTLREQVLRQSLKKTATQTYDKVLLVFHAWNLFRSGENPSKIKTPSDKSSFPKVI